MYCNDMYCNDMNMDIKLIFSDIDGTILPPKGKVSPATVEAVRRCREMGVEFVIASGRWYPAALKVVKDQLGIEDGYMIINNGGAVARCDGSMLMEGGLNEEQAHAAWAVLRDEPLMVTSYVRGGIYRIRNHYLSKFRLPEKGGYFYGGKYDVVDEDEKAFLASLDRLPYKMECYSDDESLLPAIQKKLEAAGLQVNSSFPFNLEIMAPGTGKGVAVNWLTAHLGFTREQTMGFGDFTNDLPMLNNVGWPIAVGNALDEVKDVCRYVTAPCIEDGVAKAIHKFVLGDEEA